LNSKAVAVVVDPI